MKCKIVILLCVFLVAHVPLMVCCQRQNITPGIQYTIDLLLKVLESKDFKIQDINAYRADSWQLAEDKDRWRTEGESSVQKWDNTQAYVRRDVSSAPSLTSAPRSNVVESFQMNLDEFRKCLDQSLARTLSDVNEKQLQPVLTVVGDSLNRVSKAFDDLTAPPAKLNS